MKKILTTIFVIIISSLTISVNCFAEGKKKVDINKLEINQIVEESDFEFNENYKLNMNDEKLTKFLYSQYIEYLKLHDDNASIEKYHNVSDILNNVMGNGARPITIDELKEKNNDVNSKWNTEEKYKDIWESIVANEKLKKAYNSLLALLIHESIITDEKAEYILSYQTLGELNEICKINIKNKESMEFALLNKKLTYLPEFVGEQIESIMFGEKISYYKDGITLYFDEFHSGRSIKNKSNNPQAWMELCYELVGVDRIEKNNNKLDIYLNYDFYIKEIQRVWEGVGTYTGEKLKEYLSKYGKKDKFISISIAFEHEFNYKELEYDKYFTDPMVTKDGKKNVTIKAEDMVDNKARITVKKTIDLKDIQNKDNIYLYFTYNDFDIEISNK